MRFVLRLTRIVFTFLRFGIDDLALSGFQQRPVRLLARLMTLGRNFDATPRAVRLRLALEHLGPIFIKFGQVLSTRRDLIPTDIAEELAKLQDRVPPFPADESRRLIERGLGKPVGELFASFEAEPVASASIAQVHFATLHDGREVAVKVLRPGMLEVIDDDLALLHTLARWVERLSADGKRLRPREVVAEFDTYLHDELDLVREAANAAQLRRNMADLPLIMVPEMHWDLCTSSVIVMERMKGVPISQIGRLREAGVDIPKLARDGVTIFFTQVFRDGFFHADMHPGNIQVSIAPRHLWPLCGARLRHRRHPHRGRQGIPGAELHRLLPARLQAGGRAARRKRLGCRGGTRVEQLEQAIRATCEPHFDRPLKDISLGQVLMRLFQTSRRFNVEIQPQLVLLQKTLLNVEGLGRELDPELDLWTTAKPFLERWMNEQVGWRALLRQLKDEAPLYARLIPALPRLVHQRLSRPEPDNSPMLAALLREQRRTNRLLAAVIWASSGFLMGAVVARLVTQFWGHGWL